MFLLDGNPLSPDVAFTTQDGTQYPANWLRLASPEEREAIGVTEAPDPEVYDQRFYWGPGNPKQLNDEPVTPEEGEPYVQKGLKSQWISQVKATAGSMLSQTDWMVIRLAERGVEIPESTQAFRSAIIDEANRLEAAIGACESVEDLIVVLEGQEWPKEA